MKFKELLKYEEELVSAIPHRDGILILSNRTAYMFKEGNLEELKFAWNE
jgi:hypothetical protein